MTTSVDGNKHRSRCNCKAKKLASLSGGGGSHADFACGVEHLVPREAGVNHRLSANGALLLLQLNLHRICTEQWSVILMNCGTRTTEQANPVLSGFCAASISTDSRSSKFLFSEHQAAFIDYQQFVCLEGMRCEHSVVGLPLFQRRKTFVRLGWQLVMMGTA
jgi:hypothetical protein